MGIISITLPGDSTGTMVGYFDGKCKDALGVEVMERRGSVLGWYSSAVTLLR